MKKNFWMDCDTAMDTAYEAEKDNSLPFFDQIRLALHFFVCPVCTEEYRKDNCLSPGISPCQGQACANGSECSAYC